MVDLNLPAPGQSPNWAPQLNNEIAKINTGLEGHEARVDYYGIPLTVEQFGGGLGGDDTDAFESAVSSTGAGSRVLWLNPGKVYRVSRTVNLDLTKVRGVVGNGARVVVTEDVTAFKVLGSYTGTANPNGSSKSIRDAQFAPVMTDLRISSNVDGTSRKGVGIEIENTFGVKISGCFLYDLRVGVKVTGNNRNLHVVNNEIWNTGDYCLWVAPGADLHQLNVVSNIMSYARKIIFFEGANVYNTQIVGNDLEVSSTPSVVENVIKASGGVIEDLTIASNTIEDHYVATERLIEIRYVPSGQAVTRAKGVRILGNRIANFGNGAILVERVTQLIVADNTAEGTSGGGYFLKIEMPAAFATLVNVTGNTALNLEGGGFLWVTAPSNAGSPYIDWLKVDGNQIMGCNDRPIRIEDVTLNGGSFSNNSIDMGELSNLLTESAMISITGARYVQGFHISSNSFRGRNRMGSAIRIADLLSPAKAGCAVTDNLAREFAMSTVFDVGTAGVLRDNVVFPGS